MADQNEMEKIVTPMMEHVCDHLCRFPLEIEYEDDLGECCANCRMCNYVGDIRNTYNAASQLQNAAGIVRNELMKKEDWYDALVASIHGYFYEMDKAMAPCEVAKGLADRIVGIKPVGITISLNI
ncbi:hypothetical protein ABFV83_20130 [Lacrimispora sp. BS-2]|uniref:Uncharacterized protein n=1 Tax=Lacrimispora sp. BS-2 TaxID=3151850 RepID=A0AAU7PP89_9FIRM